MTATHRKTLENHLARARAETPLNKAIRALLDELDEHHKCPECKGAKTVFYALHGMDNCPTCNGTGKRP